MSNNMIDSISTSVTASSCSGVDAVADDVAVYETQYFDFTPKSFYNGMYNAVSEYIFEALATMERVLGEECHDVMSPSSIKEAMSRFKPHVDKTINRAFDKLEIYLDENIFHIPSNVVLPEDKIQLSHPVSREEMHSLDKEMDVLRNKILAVKYANMCIAHDIKSADDAHAKISQMLKHMKDMRNIVRTAGISDIRDTLTHCADQTMMLMKNATYLQTATSIDSSETSSEPVTKKSKTYPL
ncbi:protein MIS12 homolog [Gigantopelta aegis]|uniref:protein MIS12 homolog n=1 Tax=Gigantopelta aegis TaxID=1735272 RepID=UPI001B88C6E5|nr:protein MIS12 homolog [Gigantopelta aegis]